MAYWTRAKKRRTGVIALAIIVSIVLYLAGVFSGLYANKIFKEETTQNILVLRKETKQDLDALQNYIVFLDKNLKDMQLEQIFIETLTPDQMCNFSTISMNELIKQLSFYWERLPFRIEEYERDNKNLPEEYLLLKQQYAHLSIRTWILARSLYKRCDMDLIHGLYFYSADCEVCVQQGEQLDGLSKKFRAQEKEIIMFPIDFYSDEAVIKNLKDYYGINSTPAIIINDKVFQGRLFKTEELFRGSEEGSKNGKKN